MYFIEGRSSVDNDLSSTHKTGLKPEISRLNINDDNGNRLSSTFVLFRRKLDLEALSLAPILLLILSGNPPHLFL